MKQALIVLVRVLDNQIPEYDYEYEYAYDSAGRPSFMVFEKCKEVTL